jgi:2-dehydro-3-deoxyphosphogluconate aldolase/(4S)-4-hydroxy-2-oxoglutarate aldolase
MSAPDANDVLDRAPVIPVATFAETEQALPAAEGLLRGGIGIIEVTLRTPAGLAAIERIRAEIPEMLVGAGTVWGPDDWVRAEEAGAQFVVSPGAPAALVSSARLRGIPWLPGAQTPTEMYALVEAGYRAIKFFPAASAGGIQALRAVAAVLPGVRFCPTGGITADNASAYLALSAVPCVGGSWLLPQDAVTSGDRKRITDLARAAGSLGRRGGLPIR